MNYLILFVAVTSVFSVPIDEGVKTEWESFKEKFNKIYDNECEEKYRFQIFEDAYHKIQEHNDLFKKGLVNYSLGINKYSDLTSEEFDNMMKGFEQPNTSRAHSIFESSQMKRNETLPYSIDWREKGAVTRVKDQGHCLSCWAFAATGSIEGQYFLKTGKLKAFSEQNLIDCSKKYGNSGCTAGAIQNAFKYVIENGGIDSEENYPYIETEGSCRNNSKSGRLLMSQFVDLPHGNEIRLKRAVANVGPVSVAIDSSGDHFKHYSGGIYDYPDCTTYKIDHAVLIVGYGTDKNGLDYWLVKNSWSSNWGDKGYIKMVRNKKNHCGIANFPSYPIVVV